MRSEQLSLKCGGERQAADWEDERKRRVKARKKRSKRTGKVSKKRAMIRKGNEKGAKGSKKRAKGDKKGAKSDKKGAKGDKKGAKGDKKGAKGDKKGAKGDKKGATSAPPMETALSENLEAIQHVEPDVTGVPLEIPHASEGKPVRSRAPKRSKSASNGGAVDGAAEESKPLKAPKGSRAKAAAAKQQSEADAMVVPELEPGMEWPVTFGGRFCPKTEGSLSQKVWMGIVRAFLTVIAPKIKDRSRTKREAGC